MFLPVRSVELVVRPFGGIVLDVLEDFIIIPRPAYDMIVVGCLKDGMAEAACSPRFDGTNHLVNRRAGCPHPAAVPGCMDMKKNVQMVRHDNIRIHGDIVVNRFRAAN